MSAGRGLDRRRFLELTGGGIVVFFWAGPSSLLAQERRRGYPEDPNAYLRIDEKGQVTVFSGKIEMGQGVLTSQAQLAAEELGVPLSSVHMVLGDTERCPWDMGTFGSLTIRVFGPALRAAAAEARHVLLGLAAKRLGVPREGLVARGGVVSVAAEPGRSVSYAELAQGRPIARLVGEKAVLRAAREFEVMGRSPRRLDGVDKVTGGAKFTADVRRPGLLYARLLRPPAHGATRRSLDLSAARAVPGVVVVERDDLVAVLHPDPEVAAGALSRVEAEWDVPRSPLDPETIFDHVVAAAPAADVKLSRGDVAAGRRAAGQVLESTFRTGYRAHAPIEPHTALAEVVDGKVTVWASTQTPFPTRDAVARALGLDPAAVRLITPFVGGGFGGKSASRQAIEAARLAQATGRPVQVAWTRPEEFFFDAFNPATVVKLASAVDGDGRITLWDYEVFAGGDRGTTPFPYDVANLSIRARGSWGGAETPPPGLHLFAVGPWRAPGAPTNTFAAESQVDRMAAAAKADPVAFRLRNMGDARMRRVLEAAAEAYGWKPAPAPSQKGRGVAVGVDSGTYVAVIAEVTVDRATGAVRVGRVVCAQDMGVVVNPDGARMQMEGCITMGLGYVLSEELRFRGGEILDRSFADYPIPRFSWLPEIETVLVKNDDLAPQGGGEPAIVPLGAAVANAVFDATGARLYRLPMTPERVKDALKQPRA